MVGEFEDEKIEVIGGWCLAGQGSSEWEDGFVDKMGSEMACQLKGGKQEKSEKCGLGHWASEGQIESMC